MTAYLAAWSLWIAFLASWWAAALWTARTVSGNSRASRTADLVAYIVGFGFLFVPPRLSPGLWREPIPLAWGLVAIEGVSFGFAWWARLHLGRLWSAMIKLREGHRVVDTGPYRLVRHPIYTAFIAASWALALIEASITALAGALVLTAVMSWKAKREERFLREQLGARAYDAYAARTPMLLPFTRA